MLAEHLKLQESGQFPDEPARINLKRRTNSQRNLPDVLAIAGIREIALEGLSPLCLLSLVRLGGYIVNLCVFYSCRLIGKLTAFLQLQESVTQEAKKVCSRPDLIR